MKFLIALSVLASSTVFAQDMSEWKKIKCYEPAQQGGDAEVAYVLKGNRHHLQVVYPIEQALRLNEQTGCLEKWHSPEAETKGRYLTLCPGEGQQVNGYIPVEATYGDEEQDVYCDKKLGHWFERRDDMM